MNHALCNRTSYEKSTSVLSQVLANIWPVIKVLHAWLGPNATVEIKSNQNVFVCEKEVQTKEKFWSFYLLLQGLWKKSETDIQRWKIPPWSISPRWIPPDQITPNLTLTLNQVGILWGEIDQGRISGHPSK